MDYTERTKILLEKMIELGLPQEHEKAAREAIQAALIEMGAASAQWIEESHRNSPYLVVSGAMHGAQYDRR